MEVRRLPQPLHDVTADSGFHLLVRFFPLVRGLLMLLLFWHQSLQVENESSVLGHLSVLRMSGEEGARHVYMITAFDASYLRKSEEIALHAGAVKRNALATSRPNATTAANTSPPAASAAGWRSGASAPASGSTSP